MKKILLSSLIATTLLSATAPSFSVFAEETGTQIKDTEITTNPNATDLNVEAFQEEIEQEYEFDG
ncbi:hypothetical protein [Pisciglobus halotolerans]|uniref:Uncharacterized protein n=1 Tax=Pisciglobus halotolerans TaxID=745365 RepID=A0A1I3D4U8_9LACT|nr:hypothetical protein [Pisciglobus halotolerans]SFH81742.1 hypothetical protein SAMN04489868_1291 [Pisciglobus halotolerans]